jgi:hypothetical protein
VTFDQGDLDGDDDEEGGLFGFKREKSESKLLQS